MRWSGKATREALAAQASLEGRAPEEIAHQAIRDYLDALSRADLLSRVLDSELPRYADALERLGQ